MQWEPVDEEELGVTRRQFLNRAVLGISGFSAGVLGIGMLGFLWPTGASGFGGKINAGNLDDILGEIDEKREPFYVPDAKTYIRPVPGGRRRRTRRRCLRTSRCSPGMEAGHRRAVPAVRAPRLPRAVVPVVAVVRVPVPRFEVQRASARSVTARRRAASTASRSTVDGGNVVIDTSVVVTGPPIGTNTTNQTQEGPSCI